MDLRQILRSTVLLTGITAVCASAQTKKVSFSILNLSSGVYLQMDVTGLSGSEEPKIDKIRPSFREETSYTDDGLAQAKAVLAVEWTTVPLSVVTEAKITDAQVFQKIDLPVLSSCPTCKDTLHAIRVDTIIFSNTMGSGVWRQFAPPHVNDLSLTPRIHCVYDYSIPACGSDKDECRDMLVQKFVQEWKTKPYAAILEPSPIFTMVYVSPWSQTTGAEEYAGVVAANPHNAANWIAVSRVRLATRNILKPTPSPEPGPAITVLPVWNIPTGAVGYVYNRTTSPDLKSHETGDHRTFGSLLKIGNTLEVSRTAKPRGCQFPLPDSTMGSSSWLVLADSASERALERALSPVEYPFGPPRTTAWKISGDTVWLDGSTKIPLTELLAIAQGSTRAHPNALAAGWHLARTRDGYVLELDCEAEARVVGSDGRILSDWRSLSTGRHAIPTTASGVAFVQVRAEGVRATLPIVR